MGSPAQGACGILIECFASGCLSTEGCCLPGVDWVAYVASKVRIVKGDTETCGTARHLWSCVASTLCRKKFDSLKYTLNKMEVGSRCMQHRVGGGSQQTRLPP